MLAHNIKLCPNWSCLQNWSNYTNNFIGLTIQA